MTGSTRGDIADTGIGDGLTIAMEDTDSGVDAINVAPLSLVSGLAVGAGALCASADNAEGEPVGVLPSRLWVFAPCSISVVEAGLLARRYRFRGGCSEVGGTDRFGYCARSLRAAGGDYAAGFGVNP